MIMAMVCPRRLVGNQELTFPGLAARGLFFLRFVAFFFGGEF